MGLPQDEVEKASRGFPVGQYVFLYRPIPEGVQITRVLHGARDIDAVFPPDDQPMSTALQIQQIAKLAHINVPVV